jgi:hypothetical protein
MLYGQVPLPHGKAVKDLLSGAEKQLNGAVHQPNGALQLLLVVPLGQLLAHIYGMQSHLDLLQELEEVHL